MAMITSAEHAAWPLDVAIKDIANAGLPVACLVRMKLFTLDHRLIVARVGRLAEADCEAVRGSLGRLLDF